MKKTQDSFSHILTSEPSFLPQKESSVSTLMTPEARAVLFQGLRHIFQRRKLKNRIKPDLPSPFPILLGNLLSSPALSLHSAWTHHFHVQLLTLALALTAVQTPLPPTSPRSIRAAPNAHAWNTAMKQRMAMEPPWVVRLICVSYWTEVKVKLLDGWLPK